VTAAWLLGRHRGSLLADFVERASDPADYPDAGSSLLVPGSVVFLPER
jgi:hypothetical protein